MLSELHGLSERWFQAWLEKDPATVERLMAEDYLYIGPSGLVLDRQAILAVVRSPSYRLDHGTPAQESVGDSALPFEPVAWRNTARNASGCSAPHNVTLPLMTKNGTPSTRNRRVNAPASLIACPAPSNW